LSRVNLRPAKAGFARLFSPTSPAFLALMGQPDEVSEEEFLALYPVLIRLAGLPGSP
jgi:hypothetical protein